MNLRYMMCALIAGVMLASVAVRAQSGEPGSCPKDSKLLNGGATLVFGEGDGTWWGLVIDGLNAAGFETDDDKIAFLNGVFGTSFESLDELEIFNQNLVEETIVD